MRFDSLRQPVSDDQPAGPDLDEEMDTAYLNYTLVATDRLPTSFLDVDRNPFDRSSIELEKEKDTIAGLLERTRDIRLLTLDARFNAAAGDIVGFSEATQGLAIVTETFWNDFHPRPLDGDMIARQNTIESLDDLGSVVLHLQNATIAGGSRTRAVSLRQYLIATGRAEAREGEETVTLSDVSATMTNDANAARVTEVHEAVEAARSALDTVRAVFLDKAGPENSPAFPRLTELFNQIRELIGAYRTDLVPPAAVAADSTDEYDSASAGSATLPAGAVKSHVDATAALIAAEHYFLRNEPSSPALVLVHQARLLIGKPITFALEALMPEPAQRAALRFDAGFRFDIDLERMKLVVDDAFANGIPEETAEDWNALEQSGDSDGWGSSTSSESTDGWGSSSGSASESENDGSGYGESAEGTETAQDGDGWGSSASSEEPSDSGDGWGTSSDDSPENQSEATDAGWENSQSAPEESAPEPPPEAAQPPAPTNFVAKTRPQAAELLQATETFFRVAEPSSAIPLLLAKARTYMNKDFASILSELIPREPDATV